MPTTWRVEIEKSWGSADLTRAWSNTYELVTATDVGPVAVQPAVDAIVSAEKQIHISNVYFLQYTLSPWTMLPQGYDPLNALTVTIAGNGVRTIGTNQAYDLNMCYMVRFSPAGGRTGRRFYRGCMLEADVDASAAGVATIVAGSDLANTGASLVGFRNALAPVLPNGNGPAKLYMLAMLKSGAFFSRAILSVGTPAVVPNKRNHKWFNRTKKVVA